MITFSRARSLRSTSVLAGRCRFAHNIQLEVDNTGLTQPWRTVLFTIFMALTNTLPASKLDTKTILEVLISESDRAQRNYLTTRRRLIQLAYNHVGRRRRLADTIRLNTVSLCSNSRKRTAVTRASSRLIVCLEYCCTSRRLPRPDAFAISRASVTTLLFFHPYTTDKGKLWQVSYPNEWIVRF